MSGSIRVNIKAGTEDLSKHLIFPTESSGLKGLLGAIEKAKVDCNGALTKIVESSGKSLENGDNDDDLPEDSDSDDNEGDPEEEPREKKAKN